MPKSRLEMAFQEKHVEILAATQTPEVKDLETEILATKTRIDELKAEILALQKQLQESQEAIALLESPPKWGVPIGEFYLLDQMKEELARSQSEEERFKKLEAMKSAIGTGQEMLAEKRQQLTVAQQQLLSLEEENDWVANYEPFVASYAEAYQLPVEQQAKIVQLKNYLHDASQRLQGFRAVAKQTPEEIKRWERDKPGFSPIKEAIAHYKNEIIPKQEEALRIAKLIDERDYRRFIRARTNIEKPLQELIKAQEQYVKAVERFLEIVGDGESLKLQTQVQKFSTHEFPVININEGQIEISYKVIAP
ncbi:MAG: hypothetical protein KME30_32575 [Iphinoe sp. HA4291-MV1]|jgi:vacuolar-type H+-ATPase subunit I/STV1|nr:hypothetical protein [Iphinoe sp. HA4291-MV1]